mmetsp:Transcript_9545/g.11759  ORF Transcript_9545/g.11759 Transcript_9545/m.11759 type:complete len:91 (-) Transcript_9545:97-369(-)
MLLRVLSAAIIPDPHIETGVDKLEVERVTNESAHPVCTVFEVAVLAKDAALALAGSRLATLAKNVEGRQDVVILGMHLMSLPIVTMSVHD